jgi:hypothetical protein
MLPRQPFRRGIAPIIALVLSVELCAVGARAQGAQRPYSQQAIVGLLKGEVSPNRVATLARQRGIDFQITHEVETELRRAGATDSLLATLRELAPAPPKPSEPPAEIDVQTSPGAEVYLDDQFAGRASPQGRLRVPNPVPGDHTLRVSLAGKRDYEQQVKVTAGQAFNVQAALADLQEPKSPQKAAQPPSVNWQTTTGKTSVPIPGVMHWCAQHCTTLVWTNGQFCGADGCRDSMLTVESFTRESVIMHRTDYRPYPGIAVLTGQISSDGNSIVNGMINWTYHPCCGTGAGPYQAAWGAALDTVPGSDAERARAGQAKR